MVFADNISHLTRKTSCRLRRGIFLTERKC